HRGARVCEFEVLAPAALRPPHQDEVSILMVRWGAWRRRASRTMRPSLARLAPVRANRAGDAVEGAIDEFCDQETVVVDRAGHGCPPLRDDLEADAAVVGFVADQNDEPMALCLRVFQRAVEQHAPDAAAAKRRLDRQRPEHQRRRVADADRQLAHRAHHQRADPGRERQIEQMIDMFAQTVGAEHEAAGAERAFEQAFDRLSVLWRFGQYRDGEIAHDEARDSIWRARGPSLALPKSGQFQFLLTAGPA